MYSSIRVLYAELLINASLDCYDKPPFNTESDDMTLLVPFKCSISTRGQTKFDVIVYLVHTSADLIRSIQTVQCFKIYVKYAFLTF